MLTVLVLHVSLVAVLALVVVVACRLGRFRPAVCHALWLVVLIKLLLPPVMPWPSSLQEMLPSAPEAFIATEQAQDPLQATPAVTHDAPTSVPPVQAPTSTSWRYVPLLLAVVWFTGSFFTLALHVSRIRRFRSLLEQAQPAPDWLQQCSNALAGAFGVRRPTVMVVSGLASALVWNPWRSKILVSCDLLNSIRRDEWNGILAHELAHLKRLDLWVGWLELAAACLWWWNPVLILVRRRLHLYAELACDAWVLWALPESGNQYAEVLFRIVSSETRRQTPVPAFGMAAGTAAAFKARLSMLLQGGVACRMPKKAMAAIIALLLVAAPSLTPTAKAAQCMPVTYGLSGPLETTLDAKAVLEMRLYIVKDGIKDLDNILNLPKAADIRGLYLRGLASKISPSQMTAGGLAVTMEDATLLWNGNAEPKSSKVAHVASPMFAVRGNNDVIVSAAIPAQVLKWLKAKEPLQLSFTCRPERDNIRLWLNLFPVNAPADSTVWTNVIVQAPPNQWNALVADIHGKGKERATLLMFWKRRPCDPSQPVQVLPGPTHGEFRIEHGEQESQAQDPKLTFCAEIKLTEAATADIESIVAGLPPATGATTSPADLRIFKIADKDALKRILDNAHGVELISAPRVTFHADPMCKFVLRSQGWEQVLSGEKPFVEGLKSFSGSLADFWNEEHPKAVIMDSLDEQFLPSDSKLTQHIVSGLASAIAIGNEVHDNTLDVNFYYNVKELIRHYRGHLFWKAGYPFRSRRH